MGITRDSIFTILNDMGFKYKIDKITKNDLFEADEVFYCGSASEVTPIISIDDKKISNGNVGEITSKLKTMYMDIVFAKSDTHLSWLTFPRKIKIICNE